jgi:hypothetical protein
MVHRPTMPTHRRLELPIIHHHDFLLPSRNSTTLTFLASPFLASLGLASLGLNGLTFLASLGLNGL